MKRGGKFFSHFSGGNKKGGQLTFYSIFSGGKKYGDRYGSELKLRGQISVLPVFMITVIHGMQVVV